MKSRLWLLLLLSFGNALADADKVCSYAISYHGLDLGKATLEQAIEVLGKPTGNSENSDNHRYTFADAELTFNDGTGTLNTVIIRDPDYVDVNGFGLGSSYRKIVSGTGMVVVDGYWFHRGSGVMYRFADGKPEPRLVEIVYSAQSYCSYGQGRLARAQKICHYQTAYRGLQLGSATLGDVVGVLGPALSMRINSNNKRYAFTNVEVTIDDLDGTLNTVIVQDPAFVDINGFGLHNSYAEVLAHPDVEEAKGYLVDDRHGIYYYFRPGLSGRTMTQIVYAANQLCPA